MSESRTPMTDSAAYKVPEYDDLRVVEGLREVVPSAFARRLELALAQAEKALQHLVNLKGNYIL